MISALLALAVSVSAPASPVLLVRQEHDRVALRAEAAPLTAVLSEIGRLLGARIVYDGPAPALTLTARFSGGTATEAMVAVLEAAGVGYALQLDAGGTRAVTVIVSASPARAASATASATPLSDRVDVASLDPETALQLLLDQPSTEPEPEPDLSPPPPPPGPDTPADEIRLHPRRRAHRRSGPPPPVHDDDPADGSEVESGTPTESPGTGR